MLEKSEFFISLQFCTERLNKINIQVSACLRFLQFEKKHTLFRRKNETKTKKNFLITKLKKCVIQPNDETFLTNILGAVKYRFATNHGWKQTL